MIAKWKIRGYLIKVKVNWNETNKKKEEEEKV